MKLNVILLRPALGAALVLLLAVLGASAVRATVGAADLGPFGLRASDTVNVTCPVSGQAVDGSTVVEHNGKRIGVCCARCQAAVAAWTTEQKDAYLTQLADAGKPAQEKAPAAAPAFSEPDLLTTCPIAGGPLGDKPVAVTLEGRTVRVCCGKCKAAAEADPKGTLAKVDELIAAQQRALYPLDHCVVMPDEALVNADGGDIAKEVVIGNRLFRVCCPGCIRKIQKDPAKFAAQLDEAAHKAQAATYPLDYCVVNPSHVFKEGEAITEFMVAGRLIRTCCANCEAKVRAEPLKYVGLVDAARAAAATAKK
ncbi:MAG: hypothetical protein R3F49_12240 [Planctomycetota bacterium]